MRSDFQAVIDALGTQVIGKTQQLKLAVTCLLANGHLLIEDLPGMGKTTLSHALASVFGLDFSRIQFTSDLLPSDMLGVNIFDSHQKQFQFRPGPVFNQLVLADEINRASPKTQSDLKPWKSSKSVLTAQRTSSLRRFLLSARRTRVTSPAHTLDRNRNWTAF